MTYNNTFSFNNYFSENYGMPAKPKKPNLWHFSKKNIIVLILFCWIWIPQAIIMTVKNNKKKAAYEADLKDWNDAYNYRFNNWWKEYEKNLAIAEENMKLKESAMAKLNITEQDIEDAEPFYIYGQIFNGGYWRKAVNGTYRTSKLQYTYFFFTKEQVMVYERILDLMDLKLKKETTSEFFYSDLTSVSISQDSVSTTKATSLDGGDKEDEVEIERFSLIVPGDKKSFAYTANEKSTRGVNAMRTLIREKKKHG